MQNEASASGDLRQGERDELVALRLARFSLDRSGDGVLWIAPDARLLYANDTICALLGYTRDELLRLRITDINPDFPPQAWAGYWERITAAGTLRIETRHRRKDGGEVPIEVTSRYLEFDGRAYLCSFVRDISERRRAQEALRRWGEIFEHTSTGVVVSFAGSRTIDMANPAFARLYGAAPHELIGTPIAELYPPEARADYERAVEELRTRDHVVFESRHRRRDGSTFPVLVDVAAVRAAGESVPYRIANVRDLSALKDAEARLVEQERALSTLRERERLARELHDSLGQVLSFVQLQAQAALDLLGRGEVAEARAAIEQLREAAGESTADVREFILGVNVQAALEQGLFPVLEQYLDRFGRAAGIAAGLDVPAELRDTALAPTAALQLLRIVQEALANVRKHAGATVARVYVERAGGGVQLVVADNGRGFDPQRAAEQDDGRRYGLRGMRERAAEIGATLTIDSRPGLGARVIVRLPPAAPDDTSLEGVRVLLVDDHPLFLQGMQSLLATRGVVVVGVAQSGEAGVEQARALRPAIVLMDVEMPGMGGIAATRQITAELPETTVIMLTMSEDDEHLFEALRSGASGYLLKGLDASLFFELLGRALRGDAPLAPGLAARVLAEFGRADRPARGHDVAPVGDGPGERAVPPDAGVSLVPVTLSERQVEVLTLVARGFTYQEIGERLHLSRHTVRYHMREIITQLHLKTRAEIVALARQLNHGADI